MNIRLHLHAYIHTGAAGKSALKRLHIWTPQVHRSHNGHLLLHSSPHMNPYIMNSVRRVHDIWVHMRWRMQKQTSIVRMMHWQGSYVKSLESWLAHCTCMYLCVKVQSDIHRALCSSAQMSGYFPLGWLYNAPELIYVHIGADVYSITTLLVLVWSAEALFIEYKLKP